MINKLSIVATSYTVDRLKDICDLLDSIKVQTYPNIELVYIIEGSERLYRDVKDYCERIKLPVKVVFITEKLGLGGARNLGSKIAIGEIIAFVDDDVVLDNNWAEEMVNSYKDDVIGVTGSAYPLWQDKELTWLPKELYWLVSCTDWVNWNEITEVRSLWGGNMSFRREAFEKAGSFSLVLGGDDAPMAEDLEFSLRVRARTGKKLLFNPKVIVGHKIHGYRVGFKFVAQRSHHIGVSRRLLKSTYLKKYASFNNESKVLSGMAKSILLLPKEFIENPDMAWKKFKIISTVVIFAGIGYLFPAKGLNAIKGINEEEC